MRSISENDPNYDRNPKYDRENLVWTGFPKLKLYSEADYQSETTIAIESRIAIAKISLGQGLKLKHIKKDDSRFD